jgi:hypothetical protein
MLKIKGMKSIQILVCKMHLHIFKCICCVMQKNYFILPYFQTQVLDGHTGKPLLDKPLSGAPSSDNAPGLSLEGHGNDAFLVWASGCLAHEAAVGGPLPPAARGQI